MQVESGLSKWNGRVPPLDLSNVSVCPRETEKRWHKIQPTPRQASYDVKRSSDGLPIGEYCIYATKLRTEKWKIITSIFALEFLSTDPRDWTRADVWQWLINLSLSEGLEPTPELAQKFPMNGKALCLMSLDMYLARVPVGGKMLYRDFRVRLARAMSLQ